MGLLCSTRVRRIRTLLRRARVELFIQLMVGFGPNFPDFREIWLGTPNIFSRELIVEFCRKYWSARSKPIYFYDQKSVSYMLSYFLATDDQVLGSLSDRMSLFFRRPDRVKMCYTRKFGKFRSSGNQKKEGCICLLPVLRTPACSLTIVTSYRYFGSVKKKTTSANWYQMSFYWSSQEGNR